MRRSSRDQAGMAALELILGVGLLLIPTACLVITFPTWSERQLIARNAARESARRLATASTWSAGTVAADRLITESSTDAGLGAEAMRGRYTGSVQRGGTVTVAVSIDIPAVVLPVFGTTGGWSYTATHSERVDSFRSRP
jgi:hypothetical protein